MEDPQGHRQEGLGQAESWGSWSLLLTWPPWHICFSGGLGCRSGERKPLVALVAGRAPQGQFLPAAAEPQQRRWREASPTVKAYGCPR